MKAFGIIPLVLAAVLFSGCATISTTKTLTSFDNNKQINLGMGQLFVVELDAYPTTGYRWDYQQEGNAFIEPVGEPRFQAGAAPIGMVGGGGREFFSFRTTNAGQQTLKLEYHRPFVRDVAPVQTVIYTLVIGGKDQ